MIVETVYTVNSYYLYESDLPKIKERCEYEAGFQHMEKLRPYYTNEKRSLRSKFLGKEWRQANGYRPYIDPKYTYDGMYRVVDERSMLFVLRTWISFTDPLLCQLGEDVNENDFIVIFGRESVKDSLKNTIFSITYPKSMTFQLKFHDYDAYWRRVA